MSSHLELPPGLIVDVGQADEMLVDWGKHVSITKEIPSSLDIFLRPFDQHGALQ